MLFNANQTVLYTYPGGIEGAYIIPDSVTSIGSNAFDSCWGLTSVTLGDSVTSIGNNAFFNCSGLTSVTIPDSVTSIGSNAFDSCWGLTSVTIPDSVTSIGDAAFFYCSGLTNVIIPDSVTSIGDSAFDSCSGLTSVTLGNSVTSIGSYAFRYCSGLTRVTIGNSVTSIGYFAFAYCSGLTSITIPDSVTFIDSYSFYYCSGLTSITIPGSVNSIGDRVFENCSGLTRAYFTGNAPTVFETSVFPNPNGGFLVYYLDTNTGFSSPTWNGYPTEMIDTTTYPDALWLITHSIPYDTDMSSDHNDDGVSLLMAYALNLDPKVNLSGSMPSPVVSTNQLKLEYFSGSAGVSYQVEASSDLVNWSTENVVLSGPDADQIRTAAIDRTEPSLFMRLVVNQ